MNDTALPNPDLAILKSDMDELRRDVASLIDHLKTGASHSVDHLSHDLRDEANKLGGQISGQSKKTFGEVVHQIDEHPTASALIAFGAAYLVIRMISR